MNPFNKPTCAFADPNSLQCQLHHHDLPSNAQTYTCAICGSQTINPIWENNVIICSNCHSALGTCAGCIHSTHCQFEENPSPIPKFITKTIKQGFAIMQTQVPNPERIEICCTGCPCLGKNKCKRQFNTCGSHKIISFGEEICNDKPQ